MILLFIGRVPVKFLVAFSAIGLLVLVLFIGGAYLVNKEGRISTWKSRIENFFQENSEDSYQVEQAKIAVATGGFFGKKPGKSVQRNFLPHPYSDFIFAIIIEEYGLFLGAIPLVFAYLLILYRGGSMMQRANRTFPAFLAIGLTLLIVFQAFVNMAVAVNLFPVTGQTLPFVSTSKNTFPQYAAFFKSYTTLGYISSSEHSRGTCDEYTGRSNRRRIGYRDCPRGIHLAWKSLGESVP